MKNTFIILSLLLTLPSCFRSHVELEITGKWDPEKIKDLTGSKKRLELYFTNELTVLSDPEVSKDHIRGAVSTLDREKRSGVTSAKQDPNPYINMKVMPEIQIFIAEEFREQDTVVINKNNFIQIREYRVDQSATIINYIGATAVILLTLTLILGIAAYYAYLTSNITSTL
jgi:hypothetical protein